MAPQLAWLGLGNMGRVRFSPTRTYGDFSNSIGPLTNELGHV